MNHDIPCCNMEASHYLLWYPMVWHGSFSVMWLFHLQIIPLYLQNEWDKCFSAVFWFITFFSIIWSYLRVLCIEKIQHLCLAKHYKAIYTMSQNGIWLQRMTAIHFLLGFSACQCSLFYILSIIFLPFIDPACWPAGFLLQTVSLPEAGVRQPLWCLNKMVTRVKISGV